MCRKGSVTVAIVSLQLITDRELSDTVTRIYLKVLDLLCSEHFDYGLDIVFTSV